MGARVFLFHATGRLFGPARRDWVAEFHLRAKIGGERYRTKTSRRLVVAEKRVFRFHGLRRVFRIGVPNVSSARNRSPNARVHSTLPSQTDEIFDGRTIDIRIATFYLITARFSAAFVFGRYFIPLLRKSPNYTRRPEVM